MKKYNKVILAGGNGYLGGVLANYYKPIATEVIILSRTFVMPEDNVRTLVWDGYQQGEWVSALEDADLLVNLCGKNVNCRYTQKNRKAILDSRINPTTLLGTIISKLQHPPELWINVTSATIYRHAEDRSQDEYTGEIGEGFSVDVCQAWEKAFFNFKLPHTRQIALRMGIVFGKNDGVFPRLLNLVKLGMGGKQGNGEQYVSWIHEQDVACITEWLLLHKEVEGVVNATAPNPEKNALQMKLIRDIYQAKMGLPAPAWLLKIGAILIGTETELILKSRWVLPTKLLKAGYVFKYPNMYNAIKQCMGE